VAREGDPKGRGAEADSPADFTSRAWWEILKRVWVKTGRHNIGFLAAGVAFYGFLSLAPALGLIVMLYGLIADPMTIFDDMVDLIQLVPAQAAMLINDQLSNLIKTAAATRGIALIPAVAIAVYGASGAAGGIISSLNTIYEEDEKRSFLRLTALTIAIVAAGVFIACLGLMAAAIVALLDDLLSQYGIVANITVSILSWSLISLVATLTITLIYRYGPCRAQAKWRWLSLGSITATLMWLAASLAFGWYVSVARYETTYGSLGAVVVLIMWIYICAYALLVGAFLDAEAERQTARDSTTGSPLPMGQRGAVVADTSAALMHAVGPQSPMEEQTTPAARP
jgi:membrane protein